MDTRKSIWPLFAILVITAWVLGSAIQTRAETLRYKLSAYNTQIDVMQVGDMEGHVIRLSLARGLAFFENGDVATYTNWAMGDFIKGTGPIDAYAMLTFEDGSTIVYKLKSIWKPGPRGFSVGEGTAEFTKGTGRYEGIKGSSTFSGRSYTPYSKEKGTFGDFAMDVTATYTLPQK